MDESGHILTIKLASQLNAFSGTLEMGHVIKLLRFNVLYYSHDQLEHSIDNVLVLVTSFKVLGRSTINRSSINSRLSLKLTPDATEGEQTTMESAAGESAIKKSVTASTSESVKHCSGLTCSIYGVKFCTCITIFFLSKRLF